MAAPLLYRGMTRQALDAAYNNSAAVADSPRILAGWQARSDEMRASRPDFLDLRYGDAERNRIDLFEAGKGAPLLAFIHGGYWQMRAKEQFSFLAAGPLAKGISVALVGYTLAPAKRLDAIVAEVRAGIAWLAARHAPHGVFVSGWSAGGHLAAMSLGWPEVRGGLAISGIFDLEPIRLCYLNDKLGLDEEEARRNSPSLRLPGPAKPLYIAYGTEELPELRRQSQEYGAARQRAGSPGRTEALTGRNHFTILEDLASPDGKLTELACTVMGV